MKSRNECGFANSVDLRIHHPANLMIMFSFFWLRCLLSLWSFSRHGRVLRMGPLIASEAGVSDPGMHFFTRASTAHSLGR
jgi:hypothetical protein